MSTTEEDEELASLLLTSSNLSLNENDESNFFTDFTNQSIDNAQIENDFDDLAEKQEAEAEAASMISFLMGENYPEDEKISENSEQVDELIDQRQTEDPPTEPRERDIIRALDGGETLENLSKQGDGDTTNPPKTEEIVNKKENQSRKILQEILKPNNDDKQQILDKLLKEGNCEIVGEKLENVAEKQKQRKAENFQVDKSQNKENQDNKTANIFSSNKSAKETKGKGGKNKDQKKIVVETILDEDELLGELSDEEETLEREPQAKASTTKPKVEAIKEEEEDEILFELSDEEDNQEEPVKDRGDVKQEEEEEILLELSIGEDETQAVQCENKKNEKGSGKEKKEEEEEILLQLEDGEDEVLCELSGGDEEEDEILGELENEEEDEVLVELSGEGEEEILLELDGESEEDEVLGELENGEEDEVLLELSEEEEDEILCELSAAEESDKENFSKFDEAKKNLQISEPLKIVGRNNEVKSIKNFLISALQLAKNQKSKKAKGWDRLNILDGKSTGTGGRCLYISGMPGTGKTSTLVYVIKKLLSEWDEDEEYPQFDWMCINSRKLTNPQRLMSVVYNNCTGTKKSPIAATKLLEEYLSQPGDPLIVVLDEIDFLISKSQKELYTLVDWPSRPKSRLIVVGIANTLDLPERLLMPRIASRFGKTTISFPPYSEAQLTQLLESRVLKAGCFHKDAICFCAKSVASSFGDARRVLHLARQALEIAKQQKHEQVQMIDVHRAVSVMGFLPPTDPIKRCSFHEQLILYSIVIELRHKQQEFLTFGALTQRYFSICDQYSVQQASWTELSTIVQQLIQSRLLIATHTQTGVMQKIQLYYTLDEVTLALQASASSSPLLDGIISTKIVM